MSLNSIQFPPAAIADLYRSSLIEDADYTPVIKDAAPASTEGHIGENRKNILIITHYQERVIPTADLSFLTNMLNACKLELADVAIMNLVTEDDMNYKELLKRFKSRIVFLFGLDPEAFGLPVSFPQFQIQPFANATFLFAPAFNECNTDALLKSKLWVCLRRIFVL